MAEPPVVARVLRGGRLESSHRGLAAIVAAGGRRLGGLGEAGRPVPIRSAAKPFQALPLLEAGGEQAFRLGDDEIALTCASHGGEPRHIRVVRRLLARGGFQESDLDCGAHPPMHEPSARALIRRGERIGAVHNNCSGKHAGLLLACRLFGFPAKDYSQPSHPLHREILARVADFCGVAEGEIPIAVDGCNLPVFILPLTALALGYAGLVARSRAGETRAAAAARRRVVRAMEASPFMVAGSGRFTTDFLRAGRGRWIGKEGAEGVYAVGVAASPATAGEAIGLALKIDDGSSRPRDAVVVALLERLALLSDRARSALSRYRFPAIRNVRGFVVGSVEAEVALDAAS